MAGSGHTYALSLVQLRFGPSYASRSLTSQWTSCSRHCSPELGLAASAYNAESQIRLKTLHEKTGVLRCRAVAEPQQRRKSEKITTPEFFEVDRDAASFNLIFESEQAAKTARHYEVVFMIHEGHVEEVQDVIQKVKGFIEEKEGKIYRLNDWGMRKLAYKIKRSKRAYYILMNFEIGGQEINDFKTMLDKDERVLRHLVMTKKKAERQETVPPPEFSSIRDDEEVDGYDSEEYEETDDEVEEVEEEEEVLNV